MQPLSPRERVLVVYSLSSLLGTAYRTGMISVYINDQVTVKYQPSDIRRIIDKLEVFESE